METTASHVFRGDQSKVEVIGVAVNRREAVFPRENESALVEVDGVKGTRLTTEGLTRFDEVRPSGFRLLKRREEANPMKIWCFP